MFTGSTVRECRLSVKLIHLYFLQTPPLYLQFTHSLELLRIKYWKDFLSSKSRCKPSKLLSARPASWEMDFLDNQINITVSLPRKMHINMEFYI